MECVACRGNTKFWLENMKRGDYLGELGIDQRLTQRVYFCRAPEHCRCQGRFRRIQVLVCDIVFMLKVTMKKTPGMKK